MSARNLAPDAEAPPIFADPQPREPARFPWRALLLGAVILPPLTLFGHLSYVIVQSARWTADTLLRGPVVLLFFLACWTLAWRRLSPRLGLRLGLTRQEMILVYLMVSVGTALAGESWAIHVVPALVGTGAYQAETSRPEWASWLADTPRWFTVQDPEVIRAAHRGNASLYHVTYLRALALPVAAWSTLLISLALFTQCLAQLVRRQWIQRERLSFPLINLPLTLIELDGPQAWYRNRLFWAGVAIAGSIEVVNGLNYLFPTIPFLPVKWTQFPPATDRPWSGLGPFQVSFYPFVIAIGFMVPLEVSFSMWFFFWLSRAQDMVVTMMGLRNTGGFAPALPPYHMHQATGAFLVMGAVILWRVRKDITGLWGKALDTGNRGATIGLLGSAGVALAWAFLAHIPLTLAALFLVIYGLFSIVLGRLIAESGSAMSMSPLTVHETVGVVHNLGGYPQKALVTFGWWHQMGERLSDNLLPHQVTGMRLAGDVKAERQVHLFLAVGAVLGVLVGIWSLLHIYFHYGIMSAEVRDWPARAAPQYAFGLIQNWLRGQTEIPKDKLAAFLAGGGVAALLMWLRQSYLGWPLHPIGYAVGGHFAMQQLWCPFFVAWLIKLVTMRFGGIRTYRSLLPFFLGAILGDYLVPIGWAAVGLLSGQQMYLSYPH